jgi:hypothetical protein
VVKQTIGGDGAFDFTSSQLGDFTLQSFSNLGPGTYAISETVPDGWELGSDNSDDPANITLSAGETVTCTFSNRFVGVGILTLSPPALALLAILMTLMAARMRQRG